MVEQTKRPTRRSRSPARQFEHALAVLAGEPATNFHIPEKPLEGDPPSIPTGIPSQLLQRRPDIAAAERRVAAANAQIGVATSAFYPTVSLGASGGTRATSSAGLRRPPAPSGTPGPASTKPSTTEAAAAPRSTTPSRNANRLPPNIGKDVLSAFRDVEDQLSNLRVLEQEASITARAVAAAKRSTDLSTLRYKGGIATTSSPHQPDHRADQRTHRRRSRHRAHPRQRSAPDRPRGG